MAIDKFHRRLLQSTALVIGSVVNAQVVTAAEFTIDLPSVITNGGHVLNGNDILIITSEGIISTAGVSAVDATGASNEIVNFGSLSTNGNNTYGIKALNDNRITNSGSISTIGQFGFGIYIQDNNTVINSGSIFTMSDDAEGIQANDYNIIINTGTITTTGDDGDAIDVEDDNSIINSGTISVSGDLSAAIEVGSNNTILNTGLISTTGYYARGFDGFSNNRITNSGIVTTTGNKSYGMWFFDSNIVVNTGLVTTTGDYARAFNFRDNNTITNSGTITTTGYQATGIYGSYTNTIINSGSILTSGNLTYGIYAIDGNTITNSGSIFTSGNDSRGIKARDNSIIINSGTITTTGVNGDGIHVGDNSTITNSGSVFTGDRLAAALYIGSNNTLTNSGSVFTTGERSYGIEASNTNIINNTGLILTTGLIAHGIEVGNTNTVTNSGKIISAQAKSFLLGNNNTLNLLAPSFIGGEIDLGTNTTLNITTGRSHSVLWDLSTGTMAGAAPTIDGVVPAFYNAATQQFATFDPTVFAASTDSLALMSRNISDIIGLRLSRSAARHKTKSQINSTAPPYSLGLRPSTYEADDRDNLNSTKDNGGWVSVLANRSDFDSDAITNARALTQWTVAFGYEGSIASDKTFGVLGGFTSESLVARSRFAKTFENERAGFFAGVYARLDMGAAFLDFSFTGGVTDHTTSRFVNDNLAPLGVSYAEGNYQGAWVNPSVTIGAELFSGDDWDVSSTARFSYAFQWLDGYSEAGSNANAAVSDQEVAVGQVSLGLAATKRTDFGSASLRLEYHYQKAFGDKLTRVVLINQTALIPSFAEDRHTGLFGADMNVALSETAELRLGGNISFSQRVTGVGGYVRFSSKF